ncbi:MAG: hypothetical protein IJ876_06315 [Elusimicrobiaceae bacterium]|nr:hypothetical protein [Elusimicrobiaceae bacterium]
MKQLIILLICCVIGFIVTFIHVGISRTGRVVSKLQQEVAVKEARNQYEQLEIARLSGPQVITSFAAQELGLVQAKPHEIFVLDAK